MSAQTHKISLVGSISLGTGVMLGAGIFALVGQVAEMAGSWLPWAFLAAAAVTGMSAYAYAVYSRSNPTSGGIAMLLRAGYGDGVIAGSFSLFMYVSMVLAQSLLARTFGTYLLRPFGLQDSAVLVPVLGVAAIVAAVVVNLMGNRLVEGSATVTAIIKIVGVGVLAIAGLIGAVALGAGEVLTAPSAGERGALGVVAGIGLCVLAFKGFTTITNQGADIAKPEVNLGRSIAISIALCAVLYLLVALAVLSSLSVSDIVAAKDSALADAAAPIFGPAGIAITVAVAVVATLSGLVASLFSVSRLFAMLQDMSVVPHLPDGLGRQPLLITAALALLVSVFLDLTSIASIGILLYLTMDIAVQWAVLTRLSGETGARPWLPIATIVLDVALLVALVIVRADIAPVSLIVASAVAAAIFLSQVLVARQRQRG
jgi:amino acid transporter